MENKTFNSLDDVDASLDVPPPITKKAISLDDIDRSLTSNVPNGINLSNQPEADGSGMRTVGSGMYTGMVNGLTAGYGERFIPKNVIEDANKVPLVKGTSEFIGSMGPAKGADLLATGVGKLPLMGFINKYKPVHDVTSGLIYGGASDPGPDGSRTMRALEGGGLNAIIGGFLRTAGDSGSKAKLWDEIYNGTGDAARGIKSKIDDSLTSLMNNYIKPRQQQLADLMRGKNVNVNYNDISKLWDRRAIPRPGSGSMEPLLPILKGKGFSPMLTSIPTSDAQELKTYFDSRAGYSKGKPFESGSTAKGDAEKRVADYFRSKVESIDPNVKRLNDEMSDAYQLRDDVKSRAEGDPMATVRADPSTSKGQQLAKLDKMAGTDLSKSGKDLRFVQDASGARIHFRHPGQSLDAMLKLGKIGLGKAMNATAPVSSIIPKIPSESVMNQILSKYKKDSE